jgi:hypothetical protein
MVKIVTKIGERYRFIDDTENVLLSYEMALRAARIEGNKRKIRDLLMFISRLYLQMRDRQKALECTEEALALSREIGPKKVLK